MGEESLAYTTERIIDRQHGYLSGKLDAEFLRNLASGCEEESEVRMREIMVARLDRRSEGDQPREDLERLREFMLDQNEFEERRSNLFIVRVMPLLDEAYARCAARYVMGCRESTEAI